MICRQAVYVIDTKVIRRNKGEKVEKNWVLSTSLRVLSAAAT